MMNMPPSQCFPPPLWTYRASCCFAAEKNQVRRGPRPRPKSGQQRQCSDFIDTGQGEQKLRENIGVGRLWRGCCYFFWVKTASSEFWNHALVSHSWSLITTMFMRWKIKHQRILSEAAAIKPPKHIYLHVHEKEFHCTSPDAKNTAQWYCATGIRSAPLQTCRGKRGDRWFLQVWSSSNESILSISAGIQNCRAGILGTRISKRTPGRLTILRQLFAWVFFCLFVAHRYEGENVDVPSRIMKENQNNNNNNK